MTPSMRVMLLFAFDVARRSLLSLGTGDGERDNLGGLTVVEGGRADDGGDGVDGKVPYYIPTYVLYRTGLKQKRVCIRYFVFKCRSSSYSGKYLALWLR